MRSTPGSAAGAELDVLLLGPVGVGTAATGELVAAPTGIARALLAALALAFASFAYQRRGTELVVVGNVCGPHADQLCLAPVLKGGFPLPFIYDSPGVSVEGKLALAEDRLYLSAFALDVLVYFVGILRIGRGLLRRRSVPGTRRVPSADDL
jgi:hypothetical protein